MTDPAPILDYGTGAPNPAKVFDLSESPDGGVSLLIPPPPAWRTAVTVTLGAFAAVILLAGATAILASVHSHTWPWVALLDLAAFGFAHHALSRFLSRKTPTVLSVTADGVTLSEPSWRKPRVRRFPHADLRPFRLRDLGPDLTFHRVGDLWLLRRGPATPIYLCTGPYASLAPARNRLDLALDRFSGQQQGSTP